MIRRFVAIVAGLLLLAGCSYEDNAFEQQGDTEGMKTFTSFTATLDDSAVTRAYFNDTSADGRRQICWNLSDKILVYSDTDTELKTYEMTSLSEDNVATFTGEGVTGEKFYAIFAKRIDCSVDDENSEIIHLSNAYYSSTYGFRGPMVAVSNGNALSFKQTTGVMHVNVGNVKQLGRVRFEGNNNERIGGSGYIDLSLNQPTLTLDDNANISFMTQVFLQDFDDKYTDIYYVIPPMVFENGFTVTITGTDSEDNEFAITKGFDSRFEVKPATLYSFSLVNINAELEATGSDDIIVFADPNVKQICVENWDTNGDGELSYDEAAAVKDIGTYFRNKTSIVSFDEFQCFTGVTLIQDNAFQNCTSLESIILPDNISRVNEYAFSGCTELKSIVIPQKVTTIREGAFYRCSSLNSIVFPEEIIAYYPGFDIGENAFEYCTSLTDVIFPSHTSLHTMAFGYCTSLSSISFPEDGSVSIEGVPFRYCTALTSVDLSHLSVIGGFQDCTNLQTVFMPDRASTLLEGAFGGCKSLTSFEIPNGITTVSWSAFNGCSNLESVTIPSSVTTIGNSAFANCGNLERIIVLSGNPPSLKDRVFENTNKAIIYVPSESVDAYRTIWSNYADRIKALVPAGNIAFADENVKAICVANWDTNGDGELSYDEAASVTSIPTVANKYGEKHSIFASHYYIGDYAKVITSFNELQYFTSLAVIPNGLFRGQSISDVTLPETATAIGNLAFNGCTYLRSIVIPDGITAIGDYAFYGCVGLANIGIPSGLTAVGQYAFSGCDMKSIEMPSGVKTIGSSAFSDCYNLTTIVVLSVEPPVIGNGSSTASCGLSTGCTIYVPAGAVDNYKDNTQWVKYAYQIQAIPE